jgi:hypothetical protein
MLRQTDPVTLLGICVLRVRRKSSESEVPEPLCMCMCV